MMIDCRGSKTHMHTYLSPVYSVRPVSLPKKFERSALSFRRSFRPLFVRGRRARTACTTTHHVHAWLDSDKRKNLPLAQASPFLEDENKSEETRSIYIQSFLHYPRREENVHLRHLLFVALPLLCLHQGMNGLQLSLQKKTFYSHSMMSGLLTDPRLLRASANARIFDGSFLFLALPLVSYSCSWALAGL